MTTLDMPVFEAEPPAVNPIDFKVVALDLSKPKDDPGYRVEAVFQARPDMSFGALMVELTERGEEANMDFYRRALVLIDSQAERDEHGNTLPLRDEAGEILTELLLDDDDRQVTDEHGNPVRVPVYPLEFDRFQDFVGDPDLYVPSKLLGQLAEWLTEQNAERPTQRQSGSRATRRAGQRGSGRTHSKRR